MKISIIIPNYNGENLLINNVPKVVDSLIYYEEETNNQGEIIIVDDCSTDSSVETIQSFIRQLGDKVQNYNLKFRIIENKANLGFASTMNKGVKNASGEIVVLLNTDVTPEKEFLVPLLKHFEDQKVFAVGCMDKSIENGKVMLRGRGVGRWERGFLVHARGEVDKTDTLWASGGSGAFRKSIWDKLGGFSQIYNPFYWEDIDLSYRAQKAGYKVTFEPKSIVIHKHEEGVIKKRFTDSQIKTIAYRNQFIFAWVNASDPSLRFATLLWIPYHLLKACINIDWVFFNGFILAVAKLPEIITYRFKAHKISIKTDKEVIEAVS